MMLDFQLNEKTNLIEIPVKINGNGPYIFNLDIGASKTTIKEDLVESAGIRILPETTETAKTASGDISVRLGVMNTFTVGSEILTEYQVRVHDFQNLTICGSGVNGVVGHDFLKNYVLRVNYPEKKLIFSKEEKEPLSKSGGNLVSFEYLNLDCHIVTIEAFVNGQGPVLFVLDTGAGGSVLNSEIAERFQLELKPSEIKAMSPAGPIDTKLARIDELKTVFKTFSGVTMVALPLNHLLKRKSVILGGIIGYDLLKDFELVIDYPNKQLGLFLN